MCTYEVEDKSTNGVQSVLKLLQHFFPYAQKQLGFHKPVMISFESDEENSNKLLGRTGHYNPDDFSIGIYVDGRHPKDVLRSLSHELIHHTQNCNGEFDAMENLGPGYAQDNPAMRDAELDAYKRGNIIFRDFEDLIKKGEIVCDIDFEELGEPRMSLKEWKNNELNMLLLKKWGLLKEQQRTPSEFIGDVVSGEEGGAKPTEAEILAAADERRDYRTDLTQDAESYGKGEGRVAGQRRVRGRGRREDLYEGEEELQEWNPFKPKVSKGSVTPGGSQGAYAETGGRGGTPGAAIPQADKTKIAAATTQGSGETAAKDVKDIADSAVTGRREDDKEHADEEGNRPSFAKKMGLDESEEELTRWHELAGLNEQDEDDYLNQPDPPKPSSPPTPPPPVAPTGSATPPTPPSTARRDDGKRAVKETITLDEARDLARRIFEKLSKETK